MDEPRVHSVERTSLAQFSIRDLLWLMVWGSVGSALVAFVLPRLSEAQRPRFLVGLAIALCVAVLAAAIALFVRVRLERQAGPVLIVVSLTRTPRWLFGLLWWTLSAVTPLLLTVLVITTEGSSAFLRGLAFYWLAYLSIEKAIAARWGRSHSLEFCEKGLIFHGKQFVPTERIVDCRWGGVLPNRLFIQGPAGKRWEIDVDPRQHDAVTHALVERVPAFRRWWEADDCQSRTNDKLSISDTLEATSWKAITTPARASERPR